jgi:uncharacterized membrane protein YfcA
VSFTLHYAWHRLHPTGGTISDLGAGSAWPAGALAGFTSFIAHAGGPPLNIYLLRRPLQRTAFVATTAVFFAVVNYVKLIPYASLGLLSADNLATSAALAIFAPVGVYLGVWLHRRISDRVFFTVVYALLFALGIKLIADGVWG